MDSENVVHCPMRFYSSVKKNQDWKFAGKWRDLENIIRSKVTWAQNKNASWCLSYMDRSIKSLDPCGQPGVPVEQRTVKGPSGWETTQVGEEGKTSAM